MIRETDLLYCVYEGYNKNIILYSRIYFWRKAEPKLESAYDWELYPICLNLRRKNEIWHEEDFQTSNFIGIYNYEQLNELCSSKDIKSFDIGSKLYTEEELKG